MLILWTKNGLKFIIKFITIEKRNFNLKIRKFAKYYELNQIISVKMLKKNFMLKCFKFKLNLT